MSTVKIEDISRAEEESTTIVKSHVKNRANRNKSEKNRRDQLNNFVHELAALLPESGSSPSRKVDKASTLKCAVDFMKVHNDLTVTVTGKSPSVFLTDSELGQLMFEGSYAFLFAISSSGTFAFLSESTKDVLGYSKDELLGKEIVYYMNPDDKLALMELFNSDAEIGGGMSDDNTFCVRMKAKQDDGEEQDTFLTLRCTSSGLKASKNTGQDSKSEENRSSSTDSQYLVVMAELVHPEGYRNTETWGDDIAEFDSRQSLDGKFLFLDPRCIKITGYLPYEILGSMMYEFVHCDDLQTIHDSFQSLIQCGEAVTENYRMLTKGHQWIVVKTVSYVSYNHWNSKPEFICSTHTLSRKPYNKCSDLVKRINQLTTGDQPVSEENPNLQYNHGVEGRSAGGLSTTEQPPFSQQPDNYGQKRNSTTSVSSHKRSDVSAAGVNDKYVQSPPVRNQSSHEMRHRYPQSTRNASRPCLQSPHEVKDYYPQSLLNVSSESSQSPEVNERRSQSPLSVPSESFQSPPTMSNHCPQLPQDVPNEPLQFPLTISDYYPQSPLSVPSPSLQSPLRARYPETNFNATNVSSQSSSEMANRHPQYPRSSLSVPNRSSQSTGTRDHPQLPLSGPSTPCQSPAKMTDQYSQSPLSFPNKSFQSAGRDPQSPEPYSGYDDVLSSHSANTRPQSPLSISNSSLSTAPPHIPSAATDQYPKASNTYLQSPLSVPNTSNGMRDHYPQSPLSVSNSPFSSGSPHPPSAMADQYPNSSFSIRSPHPPSTNPHSPICVPNTSNGMRDHYPQSPLSVSNSPFSSGSPHPPSTNPHSPIYVPNTSNGMRDHYPQSPLSVSNSPFSSGSPHPPSTMADQYPNSSFSIRSPHPLSTNPHSPISVPDTSNGMRDHYPQSPLSVSNSPFSSGSPHPPSTMADQYPNSSFSIRSPHPPSTNPHSPISVPDTSNGMRDHYPQSPLSVSNSPFSSDSPHPPSAMADQYPNSSFSIRSPHPPSTNFHSPISVPDTSNGMRDHYPQSPLSVSNSPCSTGVQPQSPARSPHRSSQSPAEIYPTSSNKVPLSQTPAVNVYSNGDTSSQLSQWQGTNSPFLSQVTTGTSDLQAGKQTFGPGMVGHQFQPAVPINDNAFSGMQGNVFANGSLNAELNFASNVNGTTFAETQNLLQQQLIDKQQHLQTIINKQKRQLVQIQQQIYINAQAQFSLHEIDALETSEQLQRQAQELELKRQQQETTNADLNFMLEHQSSSINSVDRSRNVRTIAQDRFGESSKQSISSAMISNNETSSPSETWSNNTANYTMSRTNKTDMTWTNAGYPTRAVTTASSPSSSPRPSDNNTSSQQPRDYTQMSHIPSVTRPQYPPAPTGTSAATLASSSLQSNPNYFSKYRSDELQAFFSSSQQPQTEAAEQEQAPVSTGKDEENTPQTDEFLSQQQKQLLEMQHEQRQQLLKWQQDELIMLQLEHSARQTKQEASLLSQAEKTEINMYKDQGGQNDRLDLTTSTCELTEADQFVVNMLLAESSEVTSWSECFLETITNGSG